MTDTRKSLAITRSATDDKLHHDNQRRTITNYLTKHNVNLDTVEWQSNKGGWTGSDDLVPLLLEGKYRAVYITEFSRLTRNYDALLRILGAAHAANTRIVPVQFSDNDNDPFVLEFVRTQLFGNASQEQGR